MYVTLSHRVKLLHEALAGLEKAARLAGVLHGYYLLQPRSKKTDHTSKHGRGL